MKRSKCLLLCMPLLLVPAVGAPATGPAPDDVYWFVSAGDFDPEETAGQLDNEGSSSALTAGVGLRRWEHLALEAEFGAFTARYDRPPLPTSPPDVTFESRMRVSSAGLIGNAKTLYEFARATVYAGAGLGIFSAAAELEGTLFGFDAERIEDDTGFGYQLIAGGAFALGERSHFGIEYRRLELEADFGQLSAGKTDIGGDYVGLTFRRTFGAKN